MASATTVSIRHGAPGEWSRFDCTIIKPVARKERLAILAVRCKANGGHGKCYTR